MEAKSMTWGGRAYSWLFYVVIGFVAALLLAAVAIPNLLRSRMASPAAASYGGMRGVSLDKAVMRQAEPSQMVNGAPTVNDGANLERKVVRTGSVELAPGVFHFKNGQELHSLPKVEVQLRVPRIACSKLLASLPPPIVPHLQGFVMQGNFDAELHAKLDMANLDTLDLGGKVGIDGCQVVKAPPEVLALSESESLVQMVEIPPQPPGNGVNETMAFIVGPDNPDFVPYAKISPNLVNAIMTTEDNGFFKHRGWVTPVFKTALRRNIENGGFRLGASSITMQMTKNLLLSQEKTLSRKLQELFLVWYLEKVLPKERILELYFNAIEFGPRLYGIGPAVRHYFGKPASDITPLEASFFASILPSPKRRYIHYCHGSLTPAWEKYLRRILTRMHERDRVNDEEFAAAMASTLTFDRAEMTMTEKQCLEWVRRITTNKPEAEPETDADAQ